MSEKFANSFKNSRPHALPLSDGNALWRSRPRRLAQASSPIARCVTPLKRASREGARVASRPVVLEKMGARSKLAHHIAVPTRLRTRDPVWRDDFHQAVAGASEIGMLRQNPPSHALELDLCILKLFFGTRELHDPIVASWRASGLKSILVKTDCRTVLSEQDDSNLEVLR